MHICCTIHITGIICCLANSSKIMCTLKVVIAGYLKCLVLYIVRFSHCSKGYLVTKQNDLMHSRYLRYLSSILNRLTRANIPTAAQLNAF